MGNVEKILEKILRGTSDANISFSGVCLLLHHLGFKERIKGSHHIFYQHGVEEILNIQSLQSKAKSYQVRQIRNLILKYKLGGDI